MKTKIFIIIAVLFVMAGIQNPVLAAQTGSAVKPPQNEEIFNFDEQQNWDPMEEMERMQQKMDRMFKETMRRAAKEEKLMHGKVTFFEPSMTIKETDTNYIVSVDLPGINKDDINVELNDHILKISGQRKSEVKKENEKVFKEEQNFGSFFSRITLPEDVRTADMNAEYKNGVLTISMPRIETVKGASGSGRKIPIK